MNLDADPGRDRRPLDPTPALLVAGGLDPTGQAGLARDVAVCASLGVRALPVPTATTTPATDGTAVHPTPPDTLAALLEAAWRDARPLWMKVGAVFNRQQAQALTDFAHERGVSVVHDPVLGPSTGGSFCSTDALRPVLDMAAVVTPNEDEALALGLQDHGWSGPVHTTRGGDLPGAHRGTGCRFATRVACLLLLGLPLPTALRETHRWLEEALTFDVADQEAGADPARRAHWRATVDGLHALLAALRGDQIPEVGINFAYALPGAKDPDRDVCGLAGRIPIAGGGFSWCGRVTFGGPHHTGRMAVTLQEVAPAAQAIMNHRFDRRFLAAARAGGLTEGTFRRDDEPDAAPSSMEWGLRHAIARYRDVTGDGAGWPDLVWDLGGPGKEPMIRILGTDPRDLARKVQVVGGRPADPDGPPPCPSV